MSIEINDPLVERLLLVVQDELLDDAREASYRLDTMLHKIGGGSLFMADGKQKVSSLLRVFSSKPYTMDQPAMDKPKKRRT